MPRYGAVNSIFGKSEFPRSIMFGGFSVCPMERLEAGVRNETTVIMQTKQTLCAVFERGFPPSSCKTLLFSLYDAHYTSDTVKA